MVAARVDYRLDRGRRSRCTRVSQIALDLCQRQIVVLVAEQHQDRGAGIGAGFGKRTISSAGIERDVGGKSVWSGIERRSQRLQCRKMGHFSAIREPDDRNVLGVDPTFAGKKSQRGVCVRNAIRQIAW